MCIGTFDPDVVADDDAVEPCYGAVAVEAGRGLDEAVMVEGKFGKRAAIRPLVEIPQQHGG